MPFFIWNYLVTIRKFLCLPVALFYHAVVQRSRKLYEGEPQRSLNSLNKVMIIFFSLFAFLLYCFFSVVSAFSACRGEV